MDARVPTPEEIQKIKDECELDLNIASCNRQIEQSIRDIENFTVSLHKLLATTDKGIMVKKGSQYAFAATVAVFVGTILLEIGASDRAAYNLLKTRDAVFGIGFCLAVEIYSFYWKDQKNNPLWKFKYLSMLTGQDYNDMAKKYQECLETIKRTNTSIEEIFSRCSKEFAIDATVIVDILTHFLENSKKALLEEKSPNAVEYEITTAHDALEQALRVEYFSKFYSQSKNPRIKFAEDMVQAIIPRTLHYDSMFFKPEKPGAPAQPAPSAAANKR